jgi:hypothetical protein
MVNEELIKYVETYLNQGYSTGQISQTLLNSGYSYDQINQIFQEINRRKYQQNIPQSKPQKIPMKFFIILGVIISLILISYFAFNYFNNKETIPITTTTTLNIVTTTTTTTIPRNIQTTSTSEKTIELFEVLLCRDIDQYLNCFESMDGRIKIGNSLYFYYRLFLLPHELDDGFRMGFRQDRLVYGPNNNIIEKWSRENALDVVRPVPDQNRYSIPGFNELMTSQNDEVGIYTVKFKIYDKFSDYNFEFETTFELVE